MITLLILNIGMFLDVGFEKVLLLYNPLTYSTADVISTYLYRVGLVVQQLQLRRSDRPVPGGHRSGHGPVARTSSRGEWWERACGEPPDTCGRRRQRAGRGRDSRATASFTWLNASVLVVVTLLILYPFVTMLARVLQRGSDQGRPGQPVAGGFNVDHVPARDVRTDVLAELRQHRALHRGRDGHRDGADHDVRVRAVQARTCGAAKLLIGIAVFTMFFNGGIIPNYVLISSLGMKNTIWAIVLPERIGVQPAGDEVVLREPPARAGGGRPDRRAGLVRHLHPDRAAAVQGGHRDDDPVLRGGVLERWFTAFLYLDKQELFPVAVYLRNLIAGATADNVGGAAPRTTSAVAANIQAVTMILAIIPILCVYPFVQRYFVSGVMLGSVKG